VEEKGVCVNERNNLIDNHLNKTYGKNGWLAYNVD
jgi:uncharacterized protein YecT (DUF1311 family)